MGDDLDAGLAQLAEQVLAAEVHLAADGIDRQPDLDALGDLGRQGLEEGGPDVARLVAVDEQVDVVLGGRDVLEDPRKVAMAVEEGIDRGRDRRREGQREVRAADLRPRDELGGAHRGRLRPDRIRVERVGRDARLAPAQGCRRGRDPGPDGQRPSSAHRRSVPRDVVSSIVRRPLGSHPVRWRETRIRKVVSRYCNALPSRRGGVPGRILGLHADPATKEESDA